MGGKTAMEFAVAFPEMIERLIVADIGPKSYPVHHTTIIKAFYSVPLKNLSSRNEADELLKEQIPDFGTRRGRTFESRRPRIRTSAPIHSAYFS